jgi:alkylhydroperoxidase/carboxymuconolactone decarboxylase family protein YurZ
LIYIAMKASQGDATAIAFHVKMAKDLGATKQEVVDAILLTLTVCGINGVANCLPFVIKEYNEDCHVL